MATWKQQAIDAQAKHKEDFAALRLALQNQLNLLYPKGEGEKFHKYNLTISHDPIFEKSQDGIRFIIAELGESSLDRSAGIYRSSASFFDLLTFTTAVLELITNRVEITALAKAADIYGNGYTDQDITEICKS